MRARLIALPGPVWTMLLWAGGALLNALALGLWFSPAPGFTGWIVQVVFQVVVIIVLLTLAGSTPTWLLHVILLLQIWAIEALCVLLGVPMAVVLARGGFRGLSVLRALVLLPLVLPPVVGGIALLYTFGRQGLLGQHLEAFGIRIAFTTAAVVLAQSFVSLPFLVVSLEGALRSAGDQYESIAAMLGGRPTTVLRTVTLPLVLPGLISGAVLAFARSLGEFGATITFAGNFPGTTQTMPLAVYLRLETNPEAAIVLALVLIAISFAPYAEETLAVVEAVARRVRTLAGDRRAGARGCLGRRDAGRYVGGSGRASAGCRRGAPGRPRRRVFICPKGHVRTFASGDGSCRAR